MTRVIRLYLLLEAAAFGTAALIHSGLLIAGYEHPQARVAETVLAVVLLAGLVVTAIRPQSAPGAALAAQTFALIGTMVGIFTIIIGVGPRTVLDVVYHVAIVTVLVSGIIVAQRARRIEARH
jgi:hypothetical protein